MGFRQREASSWGWAGAPMSLGPHKPRRADILVHGRNTGGSPWGGLPGESASTDPPLRSSPSASPGTLRATVAEPTLNWTAAKSPAGRRGDRFPPDPAIRGSARRLAVMLGAMFWGWRVDYNSIFCDVPWPHDPANGYLVTNLFGATGQDQKPVDRCPSLLPASSPEVQGIPCPLLTFADHGCPPQCWSRFPRAAADYRGGSTEERMLDEAASRQMWRSLGYSDSLRGHGLPHRAVNSILFHRYRRGLICDRSIGRDLSGVGIRHFTFKDCSSFTRVTACPVAHAP